jgi:hypothetical protein
MTCGTLEFFAPVSTIWALLAALDRFPLTPTFMARTSRNPLPYPNPHQNGREGVDTTR